MDGDRLGVDYATGIGALGDSGISQFFGNPFQDFGLTEAVQAEDGTLAGIAFGSSFAIITVALISGAPSDIPQDWFLTNEMAVEARNRLNARFATS